MGVLAAGLLWMFWLRGCETTLADIEVVDGVIVARNQSDVEWRNVRIWVNDHYAVTAVSIAPGAFVREPVRRFVASQGQTINTSTTPVTSVVVLATDTSGARIRKVWGKPQLH